MHKNHRYRVYSEHLKEKFGEKVYKLPINLPGTCPNRDGTRGTGGCIYCDEAGAGFDALSSSLSVKQQLAENMSYYRQRFNARKYIAYFQSYTNTYLPLEKFRENLWAACVDDIVGISISTRPDCLPEEYLDAIEEVKDKAGLDINIELGLQTVNYRTLVRINRGHTVADFIDAANRIKPRGFEICAHMILNLPWDDMDDVIEGAKILSALCVEYVKLHSLYIVQGTALGSMYARGDIQVGSLQEYVVRSAAFLEYLHPDIVIQRLAARGPKDRVLFSNWDLSWWRVKQEIEKYLEKNDIFQGMKCPYA